MKIREHYYQLNNINLHVVEAGDPGGEVMLFLHGFPEFWWGWRKQIEFFASQGFRLIIPDQRGYNFSSKPAGLKAYTRQQLTEDVVALVKQLEVDQVYLVGHDWGGAIAWTTAMAHPQLVKKLVVLNLPHPAVMKHFLKNSPAQMLKSWYMAFFQIPLLPEQLLRANNFQLLQRSMLRSSLKGTFSGEEMLRYKAAWQQPGALQAMLNWYRAARKKSSAPQQADQPKVNPPILLIWGKQDKFLSHRMAAPSLEYCENGKLEMIEDATHWVQHEKPELVNRLILDFIRQGL